MNNYTTKQYECFRTCFDDLLFQNNCSCSELASRIGIPVSRIYDIRNKGYKPRYEEICSIGHGLNLNYNQWLELFNSAGYELYV